MNFQDAVKKANWTLEQQVEVLLTYIERQSSDEAFHDYLGEAAIPEGEATEQWLTAVGNAISNYGSLDIERAVHSVDGDDEGAYFYEVAAAIVEPANCPDSYYEFVDTNPENWVSLITNHFGENWGRLAALVNEHGY
jgi:hypothetical protein